MNTAKILTVTLLLLLHYSSARIVFGVLESSNTLIKFDHTNPTHILSSLAITGITAGERVLGIDIRPFNGRVYLLTTESRLYTLNTLTGVATAGATLLNGCTTPGTNTYGVDFNPVADRLRIVSSAGASYRVAVDTGDCTIDGSINGSPTPSITQVAYSNNVRNAPSTTLYAIDVTASALGVVSPPNDGNYTQTGSLGVTTTAVVGFDIVGNNFWASLSVNGISSLYTIDLTTGAATLVGQIGSGAAVRAIAISFADYDRTFFGLNNNGHLFRFESEDASSVVISAITGLTSGFLLGVDFRPLNNVLYGLTNDSQVYAINTLTSVATAVGNVLNCSFTGQYFAIDWNPTVDLLRVVTDSGINYRINVNTSACFVDSPIVSTSTLVTPLISAIAYTNNAVGSTNTTLYAIDYSGDTLGTIAPPNAGIYNFIANLSQPTGPTTGFDIFGSSNNAVAAIEQNGVPYIVGLDLATAAVTFIAAPGDVFVRSLSASFNRLPYSISGYYPDIIVLTSGPQLALRINSNNTINILSSTTITGVATGTTLLGMDLRPATNELVAVGSDGKLYIVYIPTATAHLVATLNCTLSSTSIYSFDFNPVADRLRIVSNTGENYRVDVSTGGCLVDGNLQYAANSIPTAVGLGYTNSFSGANATAEYILDESSNSLAQVTVPNAGTTTLVGNTGVTISSRSPMDILTNGPQQQAYAVIGGVLYDINLGSGAARPYGRIDSSSNPIIGLVAVPQGYVAPAPPADTTSTTTATTTTTAGATPTPTSGVSSLSVSFALLGALLFVFFL